MTYTVTIRDTLETQNGIEMAEFTARVTFDWVDAEDPYYWEPETSFSEFLDVVQISGPPLLDAGLAEWAEDWVLRQTDLDEALFRDGGWASAEREAHEWRKKVAAAKKAQAASGSVA